MSKKQKFNNSQLKKKHDFDEVEQEPKKTIFDNMDNNRVARLTKVKAAERYQKMLEQKARLQI